MSHTLISFPPAVNSIAPGGSGSGSGDGSVRIVTAQMRVSRKFTCAMRGLRCKKDMHARVCEGLEVTILTCRSSKTTLNRMSMLHRTYRLFLSPIPHTDRMIIATTHKHIRCYGVRLYTSYIITVGILAIPYHFLRRQVPEFDFAIVTS